MSLTKADDKHQKFGANKSPNISDIFADLGGFGFYQKRLYIVPVLAGIVLGITLFSPALILFTPEHHCTIRANVTESNPIQKGACHLHYTSEINKSVTQLVKCQDGWDFNTEGLFRSAVQDMNWVCQDAWKAPLTQSMFYTGAIIGCIFYGWVSDAYGRYPTLLATNIILGIGGIFLPLCEDVYCFTSIRFIMGTTFNTFFVVAQILAMEYTPTDKRYLTAITRAVGKGVSGALLPWLLKYLEDWRMFHHVIYVLPLFVLLTPLFVFESTSWLMVRGEKDRVINIWKSVAKSNKLTLTEEACTRLETTVGNHICSQDKGKNPYFIDALKTPRLRRNIISMIISWTLMMTMYHAYVLLDFGIEFDIFTSSCLMGSFEFPAGILAMLSIHHLGRRLTSWVASIGTAICTLICALLAAGNEQTVTLIAFAMIGRCFADIALSGTNQMAYEIFPTVVRVRGLAVASVAGMTGSFLSSFIIHSSTFHPSMPYCILSFTSLVASASIMCLPETGCEDLANTLEEGEDFGRGQPFVQVLFFERRKKYNLACKPRSNISVISADGPVQQLSTA